MSDTGTIAIIGAGIAGVHAAETLRKEGHQGRILLLDRDKQMPYDRPPLSKEWMIGEKDDTSVLLRDPNLYERLEIDLQLGIEITDIDTTHKTIHTKDGSAFAWDKLMLATGSQLRTLSIDGDDLSGIFYLRNMTNAAAIKQYMQHIQEVVLIGAGFIGAELASSLKQLGIDVTIIERSAYPMEKIVGSQVSEYFLDLHRRNGVDVIMEDSVARFNGETTVEEVVTAKGQRIPCQAVVLSVGVTPNTQVLDTPLQTEGGYVVNEYGETSVKDVYAAGDCTSWPYHGVSVHVEHWDHAVNHGKTVAQNMIQPQSLPYSYTPYFWSDQYNNRYQYFGHAKKWAHTVLRGSIASNAFTYFYLDEQNIPQAAFIANQPKNAVPVRRMMKRQKPISPDTLADENVLLKKMK